MAQLALILTDHGRVAGRTGMGAVMGSKNLKAIAVKGHERIEVADPQEYAALRSEANRQLKSDPQTRVMHDLGSASVADYMDYLGFMPKRYYQTDVFAGAVNISGATISETILAGTTACHACVIACGRVVRLEDGAKRKGPEYETLVGFGPNLLLDDPGFAARMGELCDRYGMDSISLSNTVGLAFLLYEKGLVTEKDTDGIALHWGDPVAVEKLVHLAGRREGFGAQLSEGALRLGSRYGAAEEAVQVNGLEAAYHDPRGGSGMALVYATSPRGACHNQSDYFMVEMGQAEASLGMSYYPRHDGAEKAWNVARHQDWRSLFNSLVLCYFANVPPETVLSLINSACGMDYSLEDILRIGERSWNLKRLINIRLGLQRENDRLPKAFLSPHAPGGGTEGYIPPLDEMLSSYYTARGWDPQSGAPLPEKLRELGLDFTLPDIQKRLSGDSPVVRSAA
jgi:aldehyde:ferredoxin oxidoreductase